MKGRSQHDYMTVHKYRVSPFFLTIALFLIWGCSKSQSEKPDPIPPDPLPPSNTTYLTAWITTGDKTYLFQKQTALIPFDTVSTATATLEVDSTITYQTIDGFGYTLTGGSAYLINRLPSTQKTALLQELFGSDEKSIGISYLRISIGASDLSPEVFTYDDMPSGQTDINLDHFSLSMDSVDLVPVLQAILQINPAIKIMGTPWSPPAWMKDNNSMVGGSLKPAYYEGYARYFVRYIQAMQAKGIRIDAITPQNEPMHGGNNPSMLMTAAQQTEFIRDHLGPAFWNAGIQTKIIVWDHNCDLPAYPIEVLNDPVARTFVDGSAFHLYGGNINALSTVKNAHPDKNLYFTEQWTSATGSFDGDLKWHLRNVIIGSLRNWSRVALEWNLANDGDYKPHTPGGCSECKGALTMNGTVVRNVSYYIIAHASKFVIPGSVRIESSNAGSLVAVSFLRPDGQKVMIVLNEGSSAASFNIKFKGKLAKTTLAAGAVATYIW
jgi:glucosylceramidase